MPDMKHLVIGNDDYTVVDADAQERLDVIESAKIHRFTGTVTDVPANSTKYATMMGISGDDRILFAREIETNDQNVTYKQTVNPDDNVVYPNIGYNTNSGSITVYVYNDTDSVRDIRFELLYATIV